jgi:hypothetical protein
VAAVHHTFTHKQYTYPQDAILFATNLPLKYFTDIFANKFGSILFASLNIPNINKSLLLASIL